MRLGIALTEHCNLRCPHCIRDDVTTVRSLDVDLYRSIIEQAEKFYGVISVSFTGGEPLLHSDFVEIVRTVGDKRIPYRFVSNGWHLRRIMSLLDAYPPEGVRLSLSGGCRSTHDEERGEGSFDRVALAVALLTSRQIPAYLSLVIDRRDRHEIRATADLAEDLGCLGVGFILPQPTPGSAERDSDLAPEEWPDVVREIEDLQREPHRRCEITMDYGFPGAAAAKPCQTFQLNQIYIDTQGRVCTCCQLSQYGFNETEVVADLNAMSLAEAHTRYVERVRGLRAAQTPGNPDESPVAPFPCLRCAKTSGKLEWLGRYRESAWHDAAERPILETV